MVTYDSNIGSDYTSSSGGGGGTPQVQSDWTESDALETSFIENKPTLGDIQADWLQNDSLLASYIANKPVVPDSNNIGDYLLTNSSNPDLTASRILSYNTNSWPNYWIQQANNYDINVEATINFNLPVSQTDGSTPTDIAISSILVYRITTATSTGQVSTPIFSGSANSITFSDTIQRRQDYTDIHYLVYSQYAPSTEPTNAHNYIYSIFIDKVILTSIAILSNSIAISNNGDDNDTGRSITFPLSTFDAANFKATSNNVIVCYDASTFTINSGITIANNLYLPIASLIKRAILATNPIFVLQNEFSYINTLTDIDITVHPNNQIISILTANNSLLSIPADSFSGTTIKINNYTNNTLSINASATGIINIEIDVVPTIFTQPTIPVGLTINGWIGSTYYGNSTAILPSSTIPANVRNSSGVVGSLNTYARGDHAHGGAGETNVQSDWTEASNSDDAFIQNKPTIYTPTSTTPTNVASSGVVGTGTDFARDDHAHGGAGEANVQSDWNEASNSDDAFIQNKPVVPTAPSSAPPAVGASSSVGTGTAYARANHTHSTTGEANVQSDWNEASNSDDAFIQNKPVIPTATSNTPVDVGASGVVGTGTDFARDDHAHGGAGEANVQSDWNEASNSDDAFIQNKPVIPTATSNTPVDVGASGVVGTGTDFARDDHAHGGAGDSNVQSDWNEASNSDDAFIQNKPVIPTATSNTPVDVGASGVVGTGTDFARDDHAHGGAGEANVQSDWNEASNSDDAFIQNKPVVPTAPSSAPPAVGASSSLGTGTAYARANHTHSTTGEANVQSDWTEASNSDDAFIQNKPAIPTATSNTPVDVASSGVVGTGTDFARDDHVHGGASSGGSGEANVQSDWNETSNSEDSFIQNKPVVPTAPSSAPPVVGASSSLGTGTAYARSNHTHGSTGDDNVQSDWTETDNSEDSFIQNKPVVPTAPSSAPPSVGSGSIGTGTAYARSNHTHNAVFLQTEISNATDLNTVVTPGFYRVNAPVNRPIFNLVLKTNAILIVGRTGISTVSNSANFLLQTWLGDEFENFSRTSGDSGTTWTHWQLLATQPATNAQMQVVDSATAVNDKWVSPANVASLRATFAEAIDGNDNIKHITPRTQNLILGYKKRYIELDIDTIATNNDTRGIAGNSTHLFCADRGDDLVYVYERATKTNDSSLTITLASTNNNPRGLYLDGNILYCTQLNSNILYRYDITTKLPIVNITLSQATNDRPLSLIKTSDRFFVFDSGTGPNGLNRPESYAYDHSWNAIPSENWSLNIINNAPIDATFDGEIIWIIQPPLAKILAYDYKTKNRAPNYDIYSDLERINGIWGDENVMYLMSADDTFIAYHALHDIKQIKQATETKSGIGKIATTALATGHTDDETFMTPLKDKQAFDNAFSSSSTNIPRFETKDFTVHAATGHYNGIAMDSTKLFVLDNLNGAIFEYNRSDPSTVIRTIILNSNNPNPVDIHIDDDYVYCLSNGGTVDRIAAYLRTNGQYDANHSIPAVQFGSELHATPNVTEVAGLFGTTNRWYISGGSLDQILVYSRDSDITATYLSAESFGNDADNIILRGSLSGYTLGDETFLLFLDLGASNAIYTLSTIFKQSILNKKITLNSSNNSQTCIATDGDIILVGDSSPLKFYNYDLRTGVYLTEGQIRPATRSERGNVLIASPTDRGGIDNKVSTPFTVSKQVEETINSNFANLDETEDKRITTKYISPSTLNNFALLDSMDWIEGDFASANSTITAIWCNDTILLILQKSPYRVFVYNLITKTLINTFSSFHPLNSSGDSITSNGTTFWVLDTLRDEVFAYNVSNGSQEYNNGMVQSAIRGNGSNPVGIAYIEDTPNNRLFISDTDKVIYGYNITLSRGSANSSLNINISSQLNTIGKMVQSPDYESLWVLDTGDHDVKVINVASKNRISAQEFNIPTDTQTAVDIAINTNEIFIATSDGNIHSFDRQSHERNLPGIIPNANETRYGLSKHSTINEVINGTDQNSVITPYSARQANIMRTLDISETSKLTSWETSSASVGGIVEGMGEIIKQFAYLTSPTITKIERLGNINSFNVFESRASGIAIKPGTMDAYIVGMSLAKLIKVNLLTGEGMIVGPNIVDFGVGEGSPKALTWHNGVLYCAGTNLSGRLFSINPDTGSGTVLGITGNWESQPRDLTTLGSDSTLIGVIGEDQPHRIRGYDLSTINSGTLDIGAGNSDYATALDIGGTESQPAMLFYHAKGIYYAGASLKQFTKFSSQTNNQYNSNSVTWNWAGTSIGQIPLGSNGIPAAISLSDIGGADVDMTGAWYIVITSFTESYLLKGSNALAIN